MSQLSGTVGGFVKELVSGGMPKADQAAECIWLHCYPACLSQLMQTSYEIISGTSAQQSLSAHAACSLKLELIMLRSRPPPAGAGRGFLSFAPLRCRLLEHNGHFPQNCLADWLFCCQG